ncbi:hypothetical protein EKH79_03395 [Dyella dinghuensis]|uniref:PEGA domain-containing protein n=1 Tax=Dyella dinghuensis TaxID=1920169 RepID=A0A3S0PG05_9GAMM|nr:hypothetical protein EKH79_03395 [Dyella dinghuensis]
MRKAFSLIIITVLIAACSDRPLRGAAAPSPDGKTYLAVVDDNGGACGPLKVDGKVWSHRMGEEVPVEPGKHTIECGAVITFEIPRGTIFKFDYWGP